MNYRLFFNLSIRAFYLHELHNLGKEMKVFHFAIIALAGFIPTPAIAAGSLDCVEDTLTRDPAVSAYAAGFGSKGEEADKRAQKASSRIREIAAECQTKHGWSMRQYGTAVIYGDVYVQLIIALRDISLAERRNKEAMRAGLTSSEAFGIVSALNKEFDKPKDSWLRDMLIRIAQGGRKTSDDSSKMQELVRGVIKSPDLATDSDVIRVTNLTVSILAMIVAFEVR